MLSSLKPVLSEIETRCRPGTLISVFLDFDGTLVPISPDPAAPKLDAHIRESLGLISARPPFVVTIISGRAVEDLYTRIRVEGLIYAGNHGLEIFGRNLCFTEPSASTLREKLARLSEDLEVRLKPIPGAVVEYKGLTSSVHYRQVVEADIASLRDAVQNAVNVSGSFRTNDGRKVIEIWPPTNWHKGMATRWINRHLGRGEDDILSIYFGDDATDEDAFSMLTKAITVKVGGCQTATSARYHVPGPETVHEFLDWLAAFELVC